MASARALMSPVVTACCISLCIPVAFAEPVSTGAQTSAPVRTVTRTYVDANGNVTSPPVQSTSPYTSVTRSGGGSSSYQTYQSISPARVLAGEGRTVPASQYSPPANSVVVPSATTDVRSSGRTTVTYSGSPSTSGYTTVNQRNISAAQTSGYPVQSTQSGAISATTMTIRTYTRTLPSASTGSSYANSSPSYSGRVASTAPVSSTPVYSTNRTTYVSSSSSNAAPAQSPSITTNVVQTASVSTSPRNGADEARMLKNTDEDLIRTGTAKLPVAPASETTRPAQTIPATVMSPTAKTDKQMNSGVGQLPAMPATAAGVVPDKRVVHALLWSTNFNVEFALTKNEFGLLWDSLSPRLQTELTLSGLKNRLVGLRKSGMNLKSTIGQEAEFEIPPQLLSDGRLRLRGRFLAQPKNIRFDLLYVHTDGSWHLDAMAFAKDN